MRSCAESSTYVLTVNSCAYGRACYHASFPHPAALRNMLACHRNAHRAGRAVFFSAKSLFNCALFVFVSTIFQAGTCVRQRRTCTCKATSAARKYGSGCDQRVLPSTIHGGIHNFICSCTPAGKLNISRQITRGRCKHAAARHAPFHAHTPLCALQLR